MTTVNTLIDETHEFADSAYKVQDESFSEEVRRANLNDLRSQYEGWHIRAARFIGSSGRAEELEKFQKEYKGGILQGKISGFLSEGMEHNMFYDPSEPVPGIDKWLHPVDREFQQPLFNQKTILAGLRPRSEPDKPFNAEIHVYGGTNNLAQGLGFSQQIRVEDVQSGDLNSLLEFLRRSGITPEDLEGLSKAIEADKEASQENSSEVGEWLSKMTQIAFGAGVTGASSELVVKMIHALSNYYSA